MKMLIPKTVALWAHPVANDVSLRKFVNKIVQHGKQAVQNLGKAKGLGKERDRVIFTESQVRQYSQTAHLGKVNQTRNFNRTGFSSWFSKLLPKNANETLASNASKYFSGNGRLSLYAFVGVGFATKAGLIGIDNGPDVICSRINEMFKEPCGDPKSQVCCEADFNRPNVSLNDLDVGLMIAKGSNAAVYEAKMKQPHDHEVKHNNGLSVIEEMIVEAMETTDDTLSDCSDDYITIISESSEEEPVSTPTDDSPSAPDLDPKQYNLALKMVFNLHHESNAAHIIQALGNEALPAQIIMEADEEDRWEQGNHTIKKNRLPPHPNIVEMYGAFVDETAALYDAYAEYPAVLPQRLNPHGCGRNKTFYLVMKRYDCTLREYLQRGTVDVRTGVEILGQLVLAVTHLIQHGVAHRDIKSDNILLDLDPDGGCPRVVLSDFGCASADPVNGLLIPYNTYNLAKDGNPALMAPEIALAQPGPDQYLDYRKSDLWALGTIAYEIFGLANPFYRQGNERLDSRFYDEEDLPPLPEDTPKGLQRMVRLMLRRDPSQRPSAQTLMNMITVILWAPESWQLGPEMPPDYDITGWVLILAAWASCEKLAKGTLVDPRGLLSCEGLQKNQCPVDLAFKHNFLANMSLVEIKRAVWLLSH